MVDGKLNIKGTLTIKTGKEDKEERKGKKGKRGKKEISIKGLKQRKPRKQKGTGSGVAFTNQSFEQQAKAPYTAQALMASLALRPQITYSPEQFKAPEIQQPTITYSKFEDIPQIGYDVPVVTTKREFLQKAVPFLEQNIQRGIKEKKELLEADLREAERDADYAKDELRQKQQFYEDGMEQAQASFQKQIADLEQVAESEREKMRLELLNEKARSDANIVMEGILGKIELEAEKTKAQQEIEQLKQKSQQEIQQAKVEGKKAEIKKISTAELRGYFKREDPSFLLGNPNTKQMRAEVARREGVSEEEKIASKPPTQEDLNKFFRTPIGQTKKMEDPVAKRLEMEKKAEEEYMQKFLQETTTKSTLSESQNDKEIQRLLKMYAKPDISPSPLPDYQRSSSGLVTKKPTERDERFQMYSEDIRIKPFIVSEIGEEIGQIQKNPRYGLRDLGYKV